MDKLGYIADYNGEWKFTTWYMRKHAEWLVENKLAVRMFPSNIYSLTVL